MSSRLNIHSSCVCTILLCIDQYAVEQQCVSQLYHICSLNLLTQPFIKMFLKRLFSVFGHNSTLLASGTNQ